MCVFSAWVLVVGYVQFVRASNRKRNLKKIKRRRERNNDNKNTKIKKRAFEQIASFLIDCETKIVMYVQI